MASLGLQPDKKTREATELAAAGVRWLNCSPPRERCGSPSRRRPPRPLPGRGLDTSHSARSQLHSLRALLLAGGPLPHCGAAERDRLHDAPRQARQKVAKARMQPDSYPDLHLPKAAASSRSSQTRTPAQLCRQSREAGRRRRRRAAMT